MYMYIHCGTFHELKLTTALLSNTAKSLFDDETGSDNIKRAVKVSLLEDDLFVNTEPSSADDFNQPSEHSDLLK